MYTLTTIFLAPYPPRGQAGLIGFTLASYTAVVAAMGWPVDPAVVFFRLATLGLVGVMASWRRLWPLRPSSVAPTGVPSNAEG